MSDESKPYPYPYSQAAKLDPRITLPRPPIDPTLAPIIDAVLLPEHLDLDLLRSFPSDATAESILSAYPHLSHTEHRIPGPNATTIVLSVFAPKTATTPLSTLYYVHGGGLISGDRFSGVPSILDLVCDIPCVFVTIEYRLAPETPAPGAAEDVYTGLIWLSSNASTLNINPSEIVVLAVSGGAAPAAAACLMLRDRKTLAVPVKAQMLLSPMLDDRCDSGSDAQFEFGVPWNGVTNRGAWGHALGERRGGTEGVTVYQAPARASDLSHLPQAYIDVAECEVFRDPAVMYAMNMWRSGSTCELHVWPGGIHLFDAVDSPAVPVVGAAISAKRIWLRRMLAACIIE